MSATQNVIAPRDDWGSNDGLVPEVSKIDEWRASGFPDAVRAGLALKARPSASSPYTSLNARRVAPA